MVTGFGSAERAITRDEAHAIVAEAFGSLSI